MFPIFEHVYDITNLPTLIVGFFVALSLLPLRERCGALAWSPVRKCPPRSDPLPHSSSVVGRVAGPTFCAVDKKPVHLVVLGMQQDRSAVST
jgi:hypothetical protein